MLLEILSKMRVTDTPKTAVSSFAGITHIIQDFQKLLAVNYDSIQAPHHALGQRLLHDNGIKLNLAKTKNKIHDH